MLKILLIILAVASPGFTTAQNSVNSNRPASARRHKQADDPIVAFNDSKASGDEQQSDKNKKSSSSFAQVGLQEQDDLKDFPERGYSNIESNTPVKSPTSHQKFVRPDILAKRKHPTFVIYHEQPSAPRSALEDHSGPSEKSASLLVSPAQNVKPSQEDKDGPEDQPDPEDEKPSPEEQPQPTKSPNQPGQPQLLDDDSESPWDKETAALVLDTPGNPYLEGQPLVRFPLNPYGHLGQGTAGPYFLLDASVESESGLFGEGPDHLFPALQTSLPPSELSFLAPVEEHDFEEPSYQADSGFEDQAIPQLTQPVFSKAQQTPQSKSPAQFVTSNDNKGEAEHSNAPPKYILVGTSSLLYEHPQEVGQSRGQQQKYQTRPSYKIGALRGQPPPLRFHTRSRGRQDQLKKLQPVQNPVVIAQLTQEGQPSHSSSSSESDETKSAFNQGRSAAVSRPKNSDFRSTQITILPKPVYKSAPPAQANSVEDESVVGYQQQGIEKGKALVHQPYVSRQALGSFGSTVEDSQGPRVTQKEGRGRPYSSRDQLLGEYYNNEYAAYKKEPSGSDNKVIITMSRSKPLAESRKPKNAYYSRGSRIPTRRRN